MYEGLNSKSITKSSLPPQYTDPVEVSLLSHERTTEGYEFSYFLRLSGEDHYVLLFKFMEVHNITHRWSIISKESESLRLNWETSLS